MKNTKQLALNAVMAAMVAVLGYIAIDTGLIKITFESFPVMVSALLFGPVDGMLVGGIGTFIYQVLRYGVDPTTPLWILPYVISGAFVGCYMKGCPTPLERRNLIPIVIINELLITILNTFVLAADGVIKGYYFPGLIQDMILLRLGLAVVKGVVFALVLPRVISVVKKAIR